MNAPFRPLPPALEAAAQRVKTAAAAACERTIESLGLAALSASNVFQRDGLLGAQFDLNRKSAVFGLTFNEALDDRLVRELRPRSAASSFTSWDALSLVDDREVEVKVAAERFGLELGNHCEWELRELDGYIGAMLAAAGQTRGEAPQRNPLRPELIGYATLRAIEAVSERKDVRKVLESELQRSMAATISQTYAAIVADLRGAGLKPAGLTLRGRGRAGDGTFARGDGGHSAAAEAADSVAGALRAAYGATREQGAYGAHGAHAAPSSRHGAFGASSSRPGALGAFGPSRSGGNSSLGAFADSMRRGYGGGGRGTPLGQVGAELMSLMRRLTSFGAGGPLGAGESGVAGASADTFAAAPDGGAGVLDEATVAAQFYAASDPAPFDGVTEDGLRLAAPNLIRVHREELRRLSHGGFEHMVIDVVGTLFDQILSDPKVPPQMARLIGRLQLPVLRAALGDSSFFSSRKHPVRRFINRMASVATAFEDLESEEGLRLLQLVRELVQGIVEGDFDQVEVYEQQLVALEAFVAEQARREVAEQGDAAALLAQKEIDLRLQQRYSQQLQGELKTLDVPEFVREFIAQVWSQVLLKAAGQDGSDEARVKRMRHAGRELFMSVQPKGSPQQRKAFLLQLPKLMQELNEGMTMVGMSEPAKKAFFGTLLPAHAQSLKGEALSTLDFNLLARKVDQVLDAPMPTAADVPPTPDTALASEEAILPTLSAEEVQRIGLIDEKAVDWNGEVDIEVGAEAPLSEVDIAIEGLPAPEPGEALEPTQGKSLAEHVQIGFAYQMHLEGEWRKVRLNHVNAARTFYVFTRGKKHKQTISLTHRMLVRMCESNRLRAFESAYLIERATARTRRQLAQLKSGTTAPQALH